VTGPPQLQPEVEFIAQIVRQATEQLGATKLLVLGRNAQEAEAPLRTLLAGAKVELEVHGVLPAAEIERRLSESDALLFVRGGISSRRGSALAGIACGLPVVAFEGAETGPPITEAGVLLSPEGDRDALANNLARVLSDDALRNDLRKRSLEAREKYFSWNVIAQKFLRVLSAGAQ
jgi:glycosyltransferase involved in cell wall biosynthesis